MPKTTNWVSRATPRAQVSTVVIGGVIVATDTFTITINGKSVTYTAVGASSTTAAAGLHALAAAMTATEWTEITWTVNSSTITATGATLGNNFVLAVSKSSASGTITLATPTTASGPNAWDDANNWDNGAPANDDTVNIDLTRGSILTGLAQSALALAVLRIFGSSRTQNVIGLNDLNPAGYTENRPKYLAVGSAAIEIDCDCPRINLDIGTATACNLNIVRAGASGVGDVPPVRVIGNNGGHTIKQSGGYLGLAYNDDETFGGSTVFSSGAGTRLVVGQGATLTAITNEGATAKYTETSASLTLYGGNVTIVDYAGSAVTIGQNAVVTFQGASTSFTLAIDRSRMTVTGEIEPSTIVMSNGASIADPMKKMIWSGSFSTLGGTLSISA